MDFGSVAENVLLAAGGYVCVIIYLIECENYSFFKLNNEKLSHDGYAALFDVSNTQSDSLLSW